MSLEGSGAAFRKVVPDFDRLIVASRNHVWLVVAVVVFDEVHAAFFVGVEAEVWCGVGDGPDFGGAVEARQVVANVLVSFGLIAIFIM